MNKADLNLEMALAENRATGMLLTEIVESLLVRHFLTRAEIAGALLRAEYTAEKRDEWEKDEEDFLVSTAEIAKLNTGQWSSRFALSPQLYVLQKQHKQWVSAGESSKPPLSPDRVTAHFSTDDDGLILHIAELVPWRSASGFAHEQS